ncbi:MAG: ATP-grasp fold amidoligase family protein [Bacteroidota bacterium]
MNFFKHLYKNTELGFYIFKPFVRIFQFFQLKKYLSTLAYVKWDATRRLNYTPNLLDPKTYCEKLSWLKIYHTTPKMGKFADKLLVREYVKEKIGEKYLVPLYFVTEDPKKIIPDNLPDYPVIIKATHNSSGGVIIRDKNDPKINWKRIQNNLRWNLSENYYWNGRESQYKHLKPRIIVEKLLTDNRGEVPSDYKLHYFNGKLAFLNIDFDRSKVHKTTLYDPNWNHIDCAFIGYPMGKVLPKPDCFDELVQIGSKLAKEFICIRVDFYILGAQIYFGELTFHHNGGFDLFEPLEYDRKFGDLLDLSTLR